MGLNRGTRTVQTNIIERTWKAEVFCEYGSEPSIVAHREILHVDDNGEVILRGRNLPTVRRSELMIVGDLKAEKLFNLVETKTDDWADEDAAATLNPPTA